MIIKKPRVLTKEETDGEPEVQNDYCYKEMLRQFVDLLEKHKDSEMGYDWGQRQGAPIIMFTFDPLEYQVLKAQLEEEK